MDWLNVVTAIAAVALVSSIVSLFQFYFVGLRELKQLKKLRLRLNTDQVVRLEADSERSLSKSLTQSIEMLEVALRGLKGRPASVSITIDREGQIAVEVSEKLPVNQDAATDAGAAK